MMERGDVLEILYQISLSVADGSSNHQKAEKYIEEILDTGEVTDEIMSFIYSISDYAKDFYLRMESKKFFKNFRKFDEIDDVEKAKALSSLITHALIDSDLNKIQLKELRNHLNLLEFTDYLKFYLKSGKIPEECTEKVNILVGEIEKLEEVDNIRNIVNNINGKEEAG